VAERTSHPPGATSWADLAAADLDAAKRFYGELLGWEFDDRDMGDQGVYSMAQIRGLDAAAMFGPSEQPPHWNVYITVESADQAAERAKELGATVMAGPFDVFDAGRMAVIQDPTGAIVSAWEPRENIGAKVINEPGAFTWADLVTPDPYTASRFYGQWLGWTVEELPDAGGYRVIKNGDRANGGMPPWRDEMEGTPPNWMPYFGVADLDASLAKVQELGGRRLAGPMQVPGGSFAVVADPAGAVFSIWSGTYDE
jgi:uncharacterized protein